MGKRMGRTRQGVFRRAESAPQTTLVQAGKGRPTRRFIWLPCVRPLPENPGRNLGGDCSNGMSSVASDGTNAGQDVWRAAAAQIKEAENGAGKGFPEHLIIMVNGIIGSADNWSYAAGQFVKKLPGKVIVHCSESNSATLTFDGVDTMGDRLAEEVKMVIRNKPGVKKISFIAHSLGGLVARYAIARLYEPPSGNNPGVQDGCKLIDDNFAGHASGQSEGKIAGLEPMNFITVATPHLGSRGHKQLPFLCGFHLLEKVASFSAHWFVGRTGRHLFLTDNDDGKPSLLLRMVHDCSDLYFMSALQAFKRRVAYSNVSYDHMVGWQTASIRRPCELPEVRSTPLNEKYPHIVNVENGNGEGVKPRAAVSKRDLLSDAEEEMIVSLTQLSWERVDVNFHGSRQRLVAHNTIQVKYYWMHSEGVDVIFHMIDNLLL